MLTIALTVLFVWHSTGSAGQAAKDLHPLGWETYSQSSSSIFCGFHNQAGLADLKYFSAGFFIQQRFSVKELRKYQFAISLPTTSGNFGLQGTLSGYKNFQRQRLELAYARRLFKAFNIGAQLDYLNMHIPGYGSAHAFTFALAALYHINRKLHAGVQVFNPVRISYQKLGNDPVPDVYRIGLGYQPSKVFLLTAEFSRIEDQNLFACAFRYRIARELSLSAGIQSNNDPVFVSVFIHLQQVELILSASYHKQLGLTPGAGFVFINHVAHEL